MNNTDKILDVEFTGTEKEKYEKIIETANEYANVIVEERVKQKEGYFRASAHTQTVRVTALCLIKSLHTGKKVTEVDIMEALSDLKNLTDVYECAKKVTGIEFTSAGYSIHTDHPVYYLMSYFNKNLSGAKCDYDFLRDCAIAHNDVFCAGMKKVG